MEQQYAAAPQQGLVASAAAAAPTAAATTTTTTAPATAAAATATKESCSPSSRPPADGCVVVVLDLNPSVWRRPSALNKFLANTQPIPTQLQQRLQQQQQQQQKQQQQKQQQQKQQQQKQQQQKQQQDEQHNSNEALVRYLSFLSGAVSRFSRASALMSPQSRLAVVGMNATTSKLLYEAEPPNWLLVQSGLQEQEISLQEALAAFATSEPGAAATTSAAAAAAAGSSMEVEGVDPEDAAAAARQQRRRREGESLLAGALSIALCYVHRWRGGGSGAESRVLLLDASSKGSYAAQYIPLLNIAFAASKKSVAIDCCALHPDCSQIPEQFCDVARGRYSKFSSCFPQSVCTPGQSASSLRGDVALLQLLLFWFLPPPSLRPAIAAVSVHQKANTAVCFCHHTPVDLCFICSCCLAIYCSETSDNGKERISCDVCKSRFAKSLLKTKQAASVDVSKY